MKFIYVRQLLMLPAILLFQQLHAQAIVPDSSVVKIINSDVLLQPLIDSAVKNNPEVNRVDNSIGLAKENLSMSKKNIYNAFSLFSSYNYGTTGNITSGGLTNFTLTQSNYYNVGVGIQLPLTHIISRKNLIRSGEYQVKMAEDEKENASKYIEGEIIRSYQELKLSLRLVMTSSETKQGALVNYQMAEKEFLQGDISVSELARVQDISAKASIEFETYVNRFQTAFLQLQLQTGINLSDLIRSYK